jgi:hypothetical protein
MNTAVIRLEGAEEASWRISRDGAVVAEVEVRQQGGDVVVSAGRAGAAKPHRFPTLQSADAFIEDLMTSFAYLGCDIAQIHA